MVESKSCADFDNLAFENFQRLLDQRVVLESFLVERDGCGFFFSRNVARGREGGEGCGEILFSIPSRTSRSSRETFSEICGRIADASALMNFYLAVGVAEFGEFGLQQV